MLSRNFLATLNILADYNYNYGYSELPSYDTQLNDDQITRQDVHELPPSPVYIPSQHSDSTYTPSPSTTNNNNEYVSFNANINVSFYSLLLCTFYYYNFPRIFLILSITIHSKKLIESFLE